MAGTWGTSSGGYRPRWEKKPWERDRGNSYQKPQWTPRPQWQEKKETKVGELCDYLMAKEVREEEERQKKIKEEEEAKKRKQAEEEAETRRREHQEFQEWMKTQQKENHESMMKMMKTMATAKIPTPMGTTTIRKRKSAPVEEAFVSAEDGDDDEEEAEESDGSEDDKGADWQKAFAAAVPKKKARVQAVRPPVDVGVWSSWTVSKDELKKIQTVTKGKKNDANFGKNILELAKDMAKQWDLDVVKQKHTDLVSKDPLARWSKVDVVVAMIAHIVGDPKKKKK